MADKKVTELTEANTIDGTEVLPIVQGGVTKKIKSKNLGPYKAFVAIVSQSGTDAPTQTILQNDFDTTPTWVRASTGTYRLNFATGDLVSDKTVPTETGRQVFNRLISSGGGGFSVQEGFTYYKDGNAIVVESFGDVLTFSDDILNLSLIEVFVYN